MHSSLKLPRVLTLGLVSVLTTSAACGGEKAEAPKPEDSLVVSDATPKKAKAQEPGPSARKLQAKANQQFAPLPDMAKSDDNPITEEKVALGRQLYFDPRLSKNHDISCQSCHVLDKYGVDNEVTSPGHKGTRGERNSPSVYNAGFHLAQFWDGRAANLEEQAKGPILNPVEMAMAGEDSVVGVLKSIPGYVEAFEAAFPGEGITYDTMAKAIGAFERKLVTPAPFDEFLAGNLEALNEEQLRGLDLFLTAECVTCHTGVGVGGTMYQKLGNVKPYATEDTGRFQATQAEADKYFFKVPSLRNITKTAPYLHDGSIATLPEMVTVMVEHQTNKGTFSETEMKHMLAFLDSLTGELPTDYIQKPELPESGPDTPGPDPS